MNIERISPFSTRSLHGRVLAISRELVSAKAADARNNERLREIHCFHRDDSDSLHRMLNAIQPGSYVRPHRHLTPPKDESFVLLAGCLGVICFHDDGGPDDQGLILLSTRHDVLGVDIRAGVWHTILALEPDTVVFEVKPGPYAPASDKDFADWAPAPGTSAVPGYLADLEQILRKRYARRYKNEGRSSS